jgi:AraC family transcriptional regulator
MYADDRRSASRSAPTTVRIVDFPATAVAALEHRGPPELEHVTAGKLIQWRIAQGLGPERSRSYGVHHTDPRTTPPAEHRVDFCVTVDFEVAPNALGIVNKIIPASRCAVARHAGARHDIAAARWLHDVWLPASGEQRGDLPIFFHYVNVGPAVREPDMLTDVYLPLRGSRR